MRSRILSLSLAWALLLLGGACSVWAQDVDVPYVAPRAADTLVMLPDGSTVHVELARTPAEQAYGLMGRTSLPEGRGMLFIHEGMARHAYWMYHCKIGLDILWMDSDHQIVEMSPDTPPCKGKSTTCASYGGHEPAQYVLELPVGSIKRHRLAAGERIEFQVQ